MNYPTTVNHPTKTLLIVSQNEARQQTDSPILAGFNLAYLVAATEPNIIFWIQQHQPDLIILDLDWSQANCSQLISALRLDWLTRSIPILAIVNSRAKKLRSAQNLDCNACLFEPYSLAALEKSICSLVPISACMMPEVAI